VPCGSKRRDPGTQRCPRNASLVLREVHSGARPHRAGMSGTASARHILTILAVANLERSRTFYDAAFAWEVSVEAPVYVEYALPTGMLLGLYQREHFARNTGIAPAVLPEGAISGTEIYLRVDDVTSAGARMERAGARILSAAAPRSWGDEVAYFADPDGNVIAVARPLAA